MGRGPNVATTLEELEQVFDDTAGYARLNDLAMAHRRSETIDLLVLKIQTEFRSGSTSVRNDEKVRMLVERQKVVDRWIKARDANCTVGIQTTLIEPAGVKAS